MTSAGSSGSGSTTNVTSRRSGPPRGDLGLVGRPPDELVVEPDVPRDPALERRVDRPVLAEPRPVALFEPKRHQRAHPEEPQPVRLAGRHDPVEELALVLGRHPQLVAQVAGVVDAGQQDRGHAEVDPPERHEREGLGREVEVRGDRREHVARARPGDRQPDEAQPEHLEADRAVGRQVMAEPARVMDLRGERSEEVELVGIGRPGDRELPDDPAGVVEHRGQRDPPRRGHPRGEQRRQPGLGAGARDPVLCVVRDLGHPDPLADGRDLLSHAVPRVRPSERDFLLGFEARALEPQRVLEARRRPPDRVRLGQPVVDRGRRAAGGRPAAPRWGT